MLKCLCMSFFASLCCQAFAIKQPLHIFISKNGIAFAGFKDFKGYMHHLVHAHGRFKKVKSTSPEIIYCLAKAIERAQREKKSMGITHPYGSLWTTCMSKINTGMRGPNQTK